MPVRRLPFELIFFGACSVTCKIWRVPAFIVGHPSWVFALMSMPNVMISDFVGTPRVRLTFAILQPRLDPPLILKCCCKPSTREPFKVSTRTSSPPLWSRIGTKLACRLQFGTPFSLLLYTRFTALFPHPFPSFFSTSVLPFSGNDLLLPGTFPLWFSGRPRITLFSDGAQRFSGKMVYLGDPARSDDEKTPNRNSPQAAAFKYGAPRQPPLQDYAAHAYPSF